MKKVNTSNKEIELWKKHAHWVLFIPALISLIVATFLFIFYQFLMVFSIPLFFFTFAFLQMRSTYFAITNKNLRGSIGSIKGYKFEIPLETVENITIRSSTLGLYLNYATIEITAINYFYEIKFISNAFFLKDDILDKLINKDS